MQNCGLTAASTTHLVTQNPTKSYTLFRLDRWTPQSSEASQGRDKQPRNVACFGGHSAVVQVLLEARADTRKLVGEELPLSLACFKGCSVVVRQLLEAKADKNAAGPQGGTPLYEACSRGNLPVVRLLLDARAEADMVCKCDQLSRGETPLYVAARAGHVEVVRLLLQAGGDAERICGLKGFTPLDVALWKGRTETWFLLLEASSGRSKLVGCSKLLRDLMRRLLTRCPPRPKNSMQLPSGARRLSRPGSEVLNTLKP